VRLAIAGTVKVAPFAPTTVDLPAKYQTPSISPLELFLNATVKGILTSQLSSNLAPELIRKAGLAKLVLNKLIVGKVPEFTNSLAVTLVLTVRESRSMFSRLTFTRAFWLKITLSKVLLGKIPAPTAGPPLVSDQLLLSFQFPPAPEEGPIQK
jgi:hypothetical protein